MNHLNTEQALETAAAAAAAVAAARSSFTSRLLRSTKKAELSVSARAKETQRTAAVAAVAAAIKRIVQIPITHTSARARTRVCDRTHKQQSVRTYTILHPHTAELTHTNTLESERSTCGGTAYPTHGGGAAGGGGDSDRMVAPCFQVYKR